MLKNLTEQSDYDNTKLLNGKVIQKTLTSHIFSNKFIFLFTRSSLKLVGWKPIKRVTRERLEVNRSKVKVTRPINAVTDNAPYAGLGK